MYNIIEILLLLLPTVYVGAWIGAEMLSSYMGYRISHFYVFCAPALCLALPLFFRQCANHSNARVPMSGGYITVTISVSPGVGDYLHYSGKMLLVLRAMSGRKGDGFLTLIETIKEELVAELYPLPSEWGKNTFRITIVTRGSSSREHAFTSRLQPTHKLSKLQALQSEVRSLIGRPASQSMKFHEKVKLYNATKTRSVVSFVPFSSQ